MEPLDGSSRAPNSIRWWSSRSPPCPHRTPAGEVPALPPWRPPRGGFHGPRKVSALQNATASGTCATLGLIRRSLWDIDLSRFMEASCQEHLAAIKRVLRYVASTMHWGVHYYPERKKEAAEPLMGYSDSDLVGDVNDRKSSSHRIFFLIGGPIAW